MMKKAGLDNAKTQHDVKLAFYFIVAVLALVFIVRSLVNRKSNNKPWLKLRSRSPDPEKSDNMKLKAATRPYGSESSNASQANALSR